MAEFNLSTKTEAINADGVVVLPSLFSNYSKQIKKTDDKATIEPSKLFNHEYWQQLEKERERQRKEVLLTPEQAKILTARVNALTNEEASKALDFMFAGIAKADAQNPRIVMMDILQCVAGVYKLLPFLE